MSSATYELELADGSKIEIETSPISNDPLVLKADLPKRKPVVFSSNNPPKGGIFSPCKMSGS